MNQARLTVASCSSRFATGRPSFAFYPRPFDIGVAAPAVGS